MKINGGDRGEKGEGGEYGGMGKWKKKCKVKERQLIGHSE